MTVSWNVAPYRLEYVDRRFRVTYWLLMMDAVRKSETLVNFCETTRGNNNIIIILSSTTHAASWLPSGASSVLICLKLFFTTFIFHFS
jgi:hypothetical protein